MIDRDAAAEQLMEVFTESYLDKLFYFCLKKTDTPHEAEDLASDIALNVIAALHGGTVPENFQAWVWQIARNRYSYWAEKKQKHRDRQVDADIGELELGDDTDGVLDDLISRETLALLRRELAFISSDYRSIVVEHYHHGRSAVEIARELGIPEGTVRSKLYHARRILKEGMRMTREFGKLSYDPGYIGFIMDGCPGKNGEPMCLLKRKICKNILFAAWRIPMTAEELANEIGIALPYMEEELQMLVEATIMKKCGERYAVSVPIVSQITVERIRAHISGILPELTQALIDALEFKLDWWDDNCPGWHGGYQSREDMRWALLMKETQPICMSMEHDTASVQNSMWDLSDQIVFPTRPNSGMWHVVGLEGMLITNIWNMSTDTVHTSNCPWIPQIDFTQYRYLKEEKLQPKLVSTPGYMLIQELVKVVWGKCTEVSEMALEQLLECGYLRKTTDGYEPTICVVYSDRLKPMPPEVEAVYQEKLEVAKRLAARHARFCREVFIADMSDSLRGDDGAIAYAGKVLSAPGSWVFEEARRNGYLNYSEDEPRDGLGALLIV